MFVTFASAFNVVPLPTKQTSWRIMTHSVEPTKEQDEDGLDLDLEEMFTMFDAADKDEDFDKAIKSVKKDK
jgi:hypothetical protein